MNKSTTKARRHSAERRYANRAPRSNTDDSGVQRTRLPIFHLIDALPEMVAVCSEDNLLFVNEAGKKMLGAKTRDELLDLPVLKIVEQASRPYMEELLRGKSLPSSNNPFVEMQFKTRDQRVIDVEVAAHHFSFEGIGHVELIVRDAGERKLLSDRAKQAQRMEAVGKLASGVAHDFNNVLTTVRGYSELILDSLSPNDILREDAEEILRATDRAAALTRQLLAFSRRQVMEPRAMDLNNVIVELKKMLHRMIGEDIELITDLSEESLTIKADRSQIEQVLMNLAVNARDAIREGGRLVIHTNQVVLEESDISRDQLDLEPGRFVLLEVSDTGIGMSRETALQVFEPFFSTKARDKGTGLGLSTVYGIVKQSAGDITLESTLGKGTTFRIYLPEADEEITVPTPMRIAKGASAGWETILLVEDEKTVRVLTMRMLERAGYTVISAPNGAEALELAKQYDKPIHMILTDIVMPEMGGRELIERLVKHNRDIRVLLMSGYSDESVTRASEIFENLSLLHKPFSYEELTSKVRSVLDGSVLDPLTLS